MIKIENVEVVGWEPTIRGMRNPMNSWEKSDSMEVDENCEDCMFIRDYNVCKHNPIHKCFNFDVGPNDHDLMSRLTKGGPVHAKYRRMITVYLDITAPLYWWKEFDTYKVGTVANSCSTMHKIQSKRLTFDDFSTEHLTLASLRLLESYLDHINKAIFCYRDFGEEEDWWQIIQLLPSSYNQRRTIMLNYEVLTNIYESRKNHKLDEWRELCTWIESLPYSEIITGKKIDTENEHNEDHPERIKCQTCNGTGIEQYHERRILCRACGGIGTVPNINDGDSKPSYENGGIVWDTSKEN